MCVFAKLYTSVSMYMILLLKERKFLCSRERYENIHIVKNMYENYTHQKKREGGSMKKLKLVRIYNAGFPSAYTSSLEV